MSLHRLINHPLNQLPHDSSYIESNEFGFQGWRQAKVGVDWVVAVVLRVRGVGTERCGIGRGHRCHGWRFPSRGLAQREGRDEGQGVVKGRGRRRVEGGAEQGAGLAQGVVARGLGRASGAGANAGGWCRGRRRWEGTLVRSYGGNRGSEGS